MGGPRAEAVVVWAKPKSSRGDALMGETDWWSDMIGHRLGKAVWIMELDLHPVGAAPRRVQVEVKVPNRLYRLRDMLKGQPHFRAGISLPVEIDDRDPPKVRVDWDAFVGRGGVEELYGPQERVADTVKGFVAELRAPSSVPEPEAPRPTAASHPPVEGVDFDQWVAAVLAVQRRLDAAALEAHYQAHGFPPGRGDAISAVWYDRLRSDPVVNAWYLHDQAAR